MKTTQTRAGKKIKGRKRHIVVDTIGLADVHSASVQDRDGIFLFKLNANLRKFFADQGYIGKLQNHCLLKTGCLLTIAKKAADVTGFHVGVLNKLCQTEK